MTESLSFLNAVAVRWGVIGCGGVTEIKSVPAYQKTPGFEVAMVMGRSESKVADYAKRHGIPEWTTNADELIENPGIDAIYIATPPDSHKFYALKVAMHKKPCCIEKPMAPNYADSLEMVEAFATAEVPLFVAYYRRSLPRFLKVKEWLDDKLIGEIRHIHWTKTKSPTPIDESDSYNWRTDKTIAPGGYFDDLASHGLDLFIYLLGDIKKAHGLAVNQLGLYSAADSICGNWLHENGITGEGYWNFGTYFREDKVEIHGSEGKITFAVLDEAPLVLENASGKKMLEIENPRHVQQFHVQNIHDHLKGLSRHPSTGTSGLQTSWVMDKIWETNWK